jgi:hypothetical protein
MTIDLLTGNQYTPRLEDYSTKCGPVQPGGDCPRWKSFLARVTDEDEELQAYLARVPVHGAALRRRRLPALCDGHHGPHRASVRPQAPPTRPAASACGRTPQVARDPPMDYRDNPQHLA